MVGIRTLNGESSGWDTYAHNVRLTANTVVGIRTDWWRATLRGGNLSFEQARPLLSFTRPECPGSSFEDIADARPVVYGDDLAGVARILRWVMFASSVYPSDGEGTPGVMSGPSSVDLDQLPWIESRSHPGQASRGDLGLSCTDWGSSGENGPDHAEHLGAAAAGSQSGALSGENGPDHAEQLGAAAAGPVYVSTATNSYRICR